MTRRLGKRIGNRLQREMPLSESASKSMPIALASIASYTVF
jgi:hypothetical protein